MAVECKTNCCTPAPEYPCIMKSNKTGNIVLFSAPGTGTVLRPGSTMQPLECGTWTDTFVMGSFEPVSGDITLRNKQ